MARRREAERLFHGWSILFNEPFTTTYGDLSATARKLNAELRPEEYAKHPDVKLFSAVYRAVYDLVPSDPDQRDFRLKGELRKFRRVKGKGLPDRFRLFFIFMESTKTIIFLYMNDRRSLRKEGDANDPYRVFKRLIDQGSIGPDFEQNHRAWKSANWG